MKRVHLNEVVISNKFRKQFAILLFFIINNKTDQIWIVFTDQENDIPNQFLWFVHLFSFVSFFFPCCFILFKYFFFYENYVSFFWFLNFMFHSFFPIVSDVFQLFHFHWKKNIFPVRFQLFHFTFSYFHKYDVYFHWKHHCF